ncbi:MAG: response regulator [Sulfuricurvum sp.]
MAASILVVDDSRMMRDMVIFALNEAGYSDIDQAEDGVEALQKIAQSEPYRMIITDINMPNMDGLELCSLLRKRSGYEKTPVIILTTESSQEMRTKGKEAGASAWLVKPFVPNDLLYVVNTLFPGR